MEPKNTIVAALIEQKKLERIRRRRRIGLTVMVTALCALITGIAWSVDPAHKAVWEPLGFVFLSIAVAGNQLYDWLER